MSDQNSENIKPQLLEDITESHPEDQNALARNEQRKVLRGVEDALGNLLITPITEEHLRQVKAKGVPTIEESYQNFIDKAESLLKNVRGAIQTVSNGKSLVEKSEGTEFYDFKFQDYTKELEE